ncbi:hypothetical protein EJB05_18594, partial [Eragrostis curvula]
MPFSAIISSIDSRKSLLGSCDVFTTAKLSASGGAGAGEGEGEGEGLARAGERAAGLLFLDDTLTRGVFARVLRRRADDDTDRLGLSLLCSGAGAVEEVVDVTGVSPRRRLGHDRRERLVWRPVLGPQVDDDLRGGGDHLGIQLVVGADGNRRLLELAVVVVLLVIVVTVPDEPVTAAGRRVRRLDRHHLRLAPAAASRGRRRGREAAAAADRGRRGQLDGPPAVAPLAGPPRRRERQRREVRVGGLGVVALVERRAQDEVPRPRRVVVRRPVREARAVPRRAGRPAAARRGLRGGGGHAGAGCGGAAAPGAHVAELEEPRVRDHVGQPELVPAHGWLAGFFCFCYLVRAEECSVEKYGRNNNTGCACAATLASLIY